MVARGQVHEAAMRVATLPREAGQLWRGSGQAVGGDGAQDYAPQDPRSVVVVLHKSTGLCCFESLWDQGGLGNSKCCIAICESG